MEDTPPLGDGRAVRDEDPPDVEACREIRSFASTDPLEDRMNRARILALGLLVAIVSMLIVSSAPRGTREAGKKWGRPVAVHVKSHR